MRSSFFSEVTDNSSLHSALITVAWLRSTLHIYCLALFFLLENFDRLPSDDSGSEFEGYVEEDEDVYAEDEIEQVPLNTSPVVDVGASRTFQQTNAEPLFTTSATPSLLY